MRSYAVGSLTALIQINRHRAGGMPAPSAERRAPPENLARLTQTGAHYPSTRHGALVAPRHRPRGRAAFGVTEDTMTIATRLQSHLERENIPFEVIAHPHTATASETAEAAHVPGDHLAKSVLIHMEEGPLLAVVPSDHQVDLTALQAIIDRRLGLAQEPEMNELFSDCAPGAAPAVGAAYDVPTIVDDSLSGLDRVWFEAGDHETLVEMQGKDFDTLMQSARHGSFCCLH